MGSSHSCSIDFTDSWSASTVSKGRIKCTKSCRFTQYSSSTFSGDREVSITFKVHQLANKPMAFGLIPHDKTSECRSFMAGEAEIEGSLGCHVDRSVVRLVKRDKIFFEGNHSCNTGEVFTVTMIIQHGKVTFFVNGSKVNSDELHEMSFNGTYRLGISMMEAGQKAEAFFTCPVTFEDIWSAGSVSQEMLKAKASTNFTFFSSQLVPTTGRYVIVANILQNCGNSVGLGTVHPDSRELCKNNLPGMCPGSLACIVKDGNIFVVVNEDVKFAANVNTADPCVIMMTIDNGVISFKFDGKNVDCDELKSVRINADFRIGVGLSAQGQLVEMRGDSGTTGRLLSTPSGASMSSSGSGKEDIVKQLLSLLADAKLGSSDDDENKPLRWKDNMKSIDCDRTDLVAVSVRKFTATLYSQCVVDAAKHRSVDIRILSMKPGQLMMVGVIDEDPGNHANQHLGSSDLQNSMGFTSRGDLLLRGSTACSGNGFKEGDLLTLAFNGGQLSIKVNGSDVVNELGNYTFQTKFRWAVSFTDTEQAVKIGNSDLTSDERDFCRRKGANTTCASESMRSTPVTIGTTVMSSVSSDLKSISTSQSHSDSIAGCYIDAKDLKYGGRSLGEGSFGTVYKGTWDESDVAIKQIRWEDEERQLREIAVGRSLTQPNIATILGWSRKENMLLVVMPLFRKGSLQDRLSKVSTSTRPSPSTGGPLGYKFVFRVALGLLRAIKYMADRKPYPMVHRDIKPANILLDDNDAPMLTDFGTARSLQNTHASTQNVGTPFYMTPEQAKCEGTSPATDVYAVALVIYAVLCAPRPVRKNDKNLLKLMNEIGNGEIPPMADVPNEISSILIPAFSADPSRRPSPAGMVSSFESLRSTFGTL